MILSASTDRPYESFAIKGNQPDTMKTYLAFGWFPVDVRHVTLSCQSRSEREKHTSGTSVKTSEIW